MINQIFQFLCFENEKIYGMGSYPSHSSYARRAMSFVDSKFHFYILIATLTSLYVCYRKQIFPYISLWLEMPAATLNDYP